jgi:mannosyl-3-phosphoglycerate phosphatase
MVIFTDLDGSLLDKATYSSEPAQPALDAIKRRGIPLVFSSSKTRAEIEFYRKKLENNHPFISENGGGIFIPKGYFSFPFPYDRETENYAVLELGTSYRRLIEVLDLIKKETGLAIKGFYDLSEEELAFLCGMRSEEASLARQREYDEPFIVEGGEREIECVRKKIKEKGMNYTWGGKFHHLLGKNDKGRAVEILKEFYENEFFSVSTVGIGDSLNDLPMLLAVDQPVLLEGSGIPGPEISAQIQNLLIVDGSGPEAWNEAILAVTSGPENES